MLIETLREVTQTLSTIAATCIGRSVEPPPDVNPAQPVACPPGTLADLVCGSSGGSSPLGTSLSHLRTTLTALVNEAPAPYGSAPSIHPLFGPFLARSVLEVSCTALIARLDPFRVLTLASLQAHASYSPGKRLVSAIQWQGDIVAEGKSDVWVQDRKVEQMTRALLGDYFEHIFWRPSFQELLDLTSSSPPGPKIARLHTYDIEEFVPRTRTTALQTYSTASKGIHHEFVLPHSTYYDDASLRTLIEDAFRVVADLGIVANCCDHIAFRLPPDKAILAYEAIP